MSWLDKLPGNERQKIREKYKMSAAAYEKLRNNVKGPEDLERELDHNEMVAQLRFGLETEPNLKKALKAQLETDLKENGIKSVLQNPDVPSELKEALKKGEFDVTVESPSESEPDQLVIVPEGNVTEKIAVKSSLADSYLSQLKADI